MQDFFQLLQDSDFGVWVATAPTLLAYPTILMLHTVGLAMVVGPCVVLDLRVLGAAPGIPFTALRSSYTLLWTGFALNASTGFALFASAATETGAKWVFYAKLAAVLAALVVAMRMKPLTAADREAGAPARALAWTSLLLWASAIAAGRLMAYTK